MPVFNGKQTARVFIKYKRLSDGRLDEMPKKLWDRIQLDPHRRKEFEFVEEINLDASIPQAREGKVEQTPVIIDDLECPLCGYVADDDADLEKHKQSKHQ